MNLFSNSWIWLAGLLLLLLLSVLGLLWRRHRGRRGGIRYAVQMVAVERLQDVLLPDGMGGEIHLEQIVLTAHGILVLNVKQIDGVVFASDQMNEWAVMGPSGRRAFPNPQGDLYDRVAAVRQLVRDVDVHGFVLFSSSADFSKGRPKDTLLPDELLERFRKPEKAEIERHVDAYAQHWDRIKTAAMPAASRSPRLR